MVDFLRDVYDASIFGQAAIARDERATKLAEVKQQKQNQQRLKELEAQRKIIPLIENAYENMADNPAGLKKFFADIGAAYKQETGVEVPQELLNALAEPDFGSEVFNSRLETGTTIGEIFSEGGQPLIRAAARAAAAKQANKRKMGVLAGGQEAAPGASQPALRDVPVIQNPNGTRSTERTITIEMDGRHIVIPTIIGGRQVSEDAAVAAHRAGRNPAVGEFATEAEANAFAEQRSNAGGAGSVPGTRLVPAPAAPTGPFAAQLASIDTDIAKLEAARQQMLVTPGATPQHTSAIDQRLAALRERRSKLEDTGPLAQQKARIERREQPTPLEAVREGAPLTRGAMEDSRTPLMTPAALASQQAAAQQAEQAAGGQRKTIREVAEAARKNIPVYQRVSALVETAGKTGRLVGPLRKAIGDGLSLVLPASTVNRITNLSDVELLQQANIELALAGLKDVGGNDTERELLTLIQSKPGLLNTKQTNQFATRWALAGYEQSLHRDTLADQWISERQAEGKPASLRSTDRGGMTFNQRWDRYLSNHPLYVRVAKDLGLDPVQFATSLGFDEGKATRAFGGR